MSYTVYILCSEKTKQYYVGQTDNIDERIKKHNRGQVKSTKPNRPWVLKYSEKYKIRSEAIKREREIKSHKSRLYIEKIFRDVAQPG